MELEHRPRPNRLSLVPCYMNGNVIDTIPDREIFSVMLNPEKFTITDEIERVPIYFGNMRQEVHLLKSPTFELSKILLDTTGAVPEDLWPEGCKTIKDMIECLKNAVLYPYGEFHQVPIVQLFWCGMVFTTWVTKLTTDYTLFNINGLPLRAEVSLTFVQFFPDKWPYEEYKSPDLTHLVEVKAGDTLPLMCNRIYNDPSYYLQIARINGLTNFRQIKPGMMLEFPPIRE